MRVIESKTFSHNFKLTCPAYQDEYLRQLVLDVFNQKYGPQQKMDITLTVHARVYDEQHQPIFFDQPTPLPEITSKYVVNDIPIGERITSESSTPEPESAKKKSDKKK